jgi:hypothetical protein
MQVCSKQEMLVDFNSMLTYHVYMQDMVISFGATCICRLGQNLQQVVGIGTISVAIIAGIHREDRTHARSAAVVYFEGGIRHDFSTCS